MTEAEWMAYTDPTPMLEFLVEKTKDRKLRLFACACCRQVWDLLADERSRRAVEVGERFADGEVKYQELGQTWRSALAVRVDLSDQLIARMMALDATAGNTLEVVKAASWLTEQIRRLPQFPLQPPLQALLIRDIIGNPFRPPARFDPAWVAWNDGAVRKLGQAAYDDRTLPAGTLDPSRLAVLADALEDAGCTDRAILDHLRGPGPHVRGCWPVDLLLAKE